MDPIAALFKHLVFDVVTIKRFDLVCQFLLGAIKYDHVVFHLAFALLGRFKSPLDGTIFQLFFSLRPALHAEENHLFLALLLNILAGEDRSDPSLNELGSKLLLFRTRKVCDLA